MRGLLALAFMLFLVMPGRAGADQPVITAKGVNACTLKYKGFCGMWAPSSSHAPRVIMTIMGDTLTWDNGDRAQCLLVDEGEQGDNLYLIMRCRLTFFDKSVKDPAFFLFHMRQGENNLIMVDGQSTECLVSGWETMVKTNRKYMRDSKPGCGGFSTDPHYRHKP